MRNGQWSVVEGKAGRTTRRACCIGYCALAAALAAGCTKARAETVPDGPPLAMPAPPPREIMPVEVLAEAPPPPETPVTATPTPTAKAPVTRRPAAPAAEAQKPPDTQPAPAPAAVEAPVRTPAVNPAEEKRIVEILQRASRDLGTVDYRNLQGDGKAQYEESKRFSELADGAIKERNYPLAATLADKAATIAGQLLNR